MISELTEETAYNGQNATALVTSSRSRFAVGGRVTLPTFKPIPSFTEAEKRRFWSRVEKTDSCWIWLGCKRGRMRYGCFRVGGIQFSAHVVAFVLACGRMVRPGLCLDHLCSTPSCCNPAHLEEVTVGENTLRGMGLAARNRRKTHCKHGHKFTPDNTLSRLVRGRPARECLACKRAKNAGQALAKTRSRHLTSLREDLT